MYFVLCIFKFSFEGIKIKKTFYRIYGKLNHLGQIKHIEGFIKHSLIEYNIYYMSYIIYAMYIFCWKSVDVSLNWFSNNKTLEFYIFENLSKQIFYHREQIKIEILTSAFSWPTKGCFWPISYSISRIITIWDYLDETILLWWCISRSSLSCIKELRYVLMELLFIYRMKSSSTFTIQNGKLAICLFFDILYFAFSSV